MLKLIRSNRSVTRKARSASIRRKATKNESWATSTDDQKEEVEVTTLNKIDCRLFKKIVLALSYVEQQCISSNSSSSSQQQIYTEKPEPSDEHKINSAIKLMTSAEQSDIQFKNFGTNVIAWAIIEVLRDYEPLVPSKLFLKVMDIEDRGSDIEPLIVRPEWDHSQGVLFIALMHHLAKVCRSEHCDANAETLGLLFGDLLLREETSHQLGLYNAHKKGQVIKTVINHMIRAFDDDNDDSNDNDDNIQSDNDNKQQDLVAIPFGTALPLSPDRCNVRTDLDLHVLDVALMEVTQRRIQAADEALQRAKTVLT